MRKHIQRERNTWRWLLAVVVTIGLAIGSLSAEPPAKSKPAKSPAPVAKQSNGAKTSPKGKPTNPAKKKPGKKQGNKQGKGKGKGKGKKPLPIVETPAPFLDFLYPAGAQQGKTVEVTAVGTNLAGASAVRSSGRGVSVRVLQEVNPMTVRLSIAVAADAELGVHDIRFITAGGISNRFRFTVSDLPEMKEAEPNSEFARAQSLSSLPLVINGQLFEADRDYYRFSAKAGETLVCEAQARAILPFMADAVPGWCDASLSLYDASGKEVAYDDDYHLQPDPVLIYRIPKDGEYVVAIHDILYRGRGNFVYRLKIGALPYITNIFPLGGSQNTNTTVQLDGVNLPVKTVEVAPAADRLALRTIRVSRQGVSSNAMPFAAGDFPEIREAEPNDSALQAQRVAGPATINGRIDNPRDADYYVFHAKARQQLVMEVHARRLGSPLDSGLTLFNPQNRELAENDDFVDPASGMATHHADARLVYKFPNAGDYVLRIRDIQGNGGLGYAYRLTIAPPEPDFALRITPDNLRVGQGETTVVTVQALRTDAFKGPIDLAIKNLPPGFVASTATVSDRQNETRFTITAPSTTPVGIYEPRIFGTATLGDEASKPVVREAKPAETVMQAFAYRHNVPAEEFSLAVTEPSSFHPVLASPSDKVLEIQQGGEIQIPLKVFRKSDFKLGLNLGQNGRAVGLVIKGVYLPPDREEATLIVTALPKAPVGLVQNLILSASLKLKNTGKIDRSVVRVAPAIPIKIVAAEKPAPAKTVAR